MNSNPVKHEPGAGAPAFEQGRTISELVVPVVIESAHDRVFPLVGLLAEAWRLPIRLIHVTASLSSVDVDLESVRRELQAWYPHFDIRAEHLTGDDPGRTIADEVGATALLVVSTDHIDAWAVKGSIAESAVDRVGVPVLLLGKHVTKTSVRDRKLDGEVVVGLDGSATAEAGFDAALALAKAIGTRLWLVQVVPEPLEADVHRPDLPGYLQRLAEEHSGEVDIRWEIIQSNDPVTAIESFAERRDAAFLVAATRDRASTQRHTMASIASGLAGTAHRPVLVLKVPDVPTIEAG